LRIQTWRYREMLSPHRLFFSGRSWPRTHVIDRGQLEFKLAPGSPQPEPWLSFKLAASGKGRPWSTRIPLAFWRSFVEADFNDEATVLGFAQRYGDPEDELNGSGGTADSAKWIGIQSEMLYLAQAWGEPDANGVSRRLSDDDQRLKQALGWWRFMLRNGAAGLRLERDPDGGFEMVPVAATLRTFMVASAGSALARAVPMRRCRYCRHWFELLRKDANYCSPSCRTFYAAQKNEPGAA
jgi:hypothetical protein